MRFAILSAAMAWLCLLPAPGVMALRAHIQLRMQGMTVVVEPARVRIMDGDTAEIHWSLADVETVRVLGIDTAELFDRRGRHGGTPTLAGIEARGFARGAFSVARRVELLRAAGLDRYRRTLGYFFLDGRNYSVLVIEAGLARETVTRFGDNGFPREAEEVRRAVRRVRATGGR